MMMGAARFVNICLLTKQAVNLTRRTPTVKIGLLQHDLTGGGLIFQQKSVKWWSKAAEKQQSNSGKKD